MAESMIENVFFSFVPSFCDSSGSRSGIRQLVDIAEDSKLFTLQKPGKLHEIIGHINTCLNSAKQRVEGLVFLDKVLEQCVTEVFTHNTLTWIRFMIQIFQSHDPPSTQRLACYVCSRILGIVSDFTSLSREVTSLVPQILSALLSAPTEWRNEACLCINSCISNYPGPCAAFKGKIDSFVVKELSCDVVSKEVMRCFALLSRCGGGGNMGLKHTEGWSVQFNRVVNSLHRLFDHLYEGLDTVMPPVAGEDGTRALPLEDLPTSYPQRYHALMSRCHAYSGCLQALLSESFQALVKIPAQAVLNLVCRILSVNCKMLVARPSTERLLLAGFIPSIHRLAISLLYNLIKCCKLHLLPHTKLVLTLLVQELVWSHSTPNYGQARPYSELRKSVYNCLTLWFQMTVTFVETSTEDSALCEEILHDAGMQLDTFKLSSGAGDSTSKSDPQPPPRKKKKTGYQEISQGISSLRKIDRLAGADLVSAALEALYWWLTAIGSQMSQKILQNVQEFAIPTCLAMFQQRKNSEIPYRDPCCRYQILRVLLACCLVPHPSTPSPLHCSLGIFRMGLHDQSFKVNKICLEAQRTLEALIHPRAPCIKAPVVVTQVLTVGGSKDSQTDQTVDTNKDLNGHHDIEKSSNFIQQQSDSQNFTSSHKRRSLFSHSENSSDFEIGEAGKRIFSRTKNYDMSSHVQNESKTNEVTAAISRYNDDMEASTSQQGHIVQQDLEVMEEDEDSSESESHTEMEVSVDTSVMVDGRDPGVTEHTGGEVDEEDTVVTECTSATDCAAVPESSPDLLDAKAVEDLEEHCDRKGRKQEVDTKDTVVREVIKDSEEELNENQEDAEENSELELMLSSFVNTATDDKDQ